jgi:hypothetical protein
MKRFVEVSAVALFIVLASAAAWAQATAELAGTVRDESGAVLPGVTEALYIPAIPAPPRASPA